MKNFLKFSLTALAVMFLLGAATVTQTNAQAGVLGEILKRMDDHNKNLSSLKADVKMVKYNSQLEDNDVRQGQITYLPVKGKNPYVRIDWTSPNESLAIVNKEYVLYQPNLKQYYTGKVDQAKNSAKSGNALAFINMSKAQLKANYTIRYVGQENVDGGTPTWHIELTPKTAASYRVANVWVDGNGMPLQAKVTENKNNDTTTIFLSNLKKNEKIQASVFVIDTRGAKMIKG